MNVTDVYGSEAVACYERRASHSERLGRGRIGHFNFRAPAICDTECDWSHGRWTE
jgi:hypothetical protein